MEGRSLGFLTVLCLGLRLGAVVASVTVYGWAGVFVIPAKHLGMAWAFLQHRGGRGGFMAAGCPDSEFFRRGST